MSRLEQIRQRVERYDNPPWHYAEGHMQLAGLLIADAVHTLEMHAPEDLRLLLAVAEAAQAVIDGDWTWDAEERTRFVTLCEALDALA